MCERRRSAASVVSASCARGGVLASASAPVSAAILSAILLPIHLAVLLSILLPVHLAVLLPIFAAILPAIILSVFPAVLLPVGATVFAAIFLPDIRLGQHGVRSQDSGYWHGCEDGKAHQDAGFHKRCWLHRNPP